MGKIVGFVSATVVFLAIFVMAGTAWASASFFKSTDSSVNNNGVLVVSFDERGLGNDNVDYTLVAHGTAVYACMNGGGNHPQAANKEAVNAELSASATFEPKNGRIVASIEVGPPSAGDFECPNGQHLVLASVSYTNIVLSDLTNGEVVFVEDASKVFLVL